MPINCTPLGAGQDVGKSCVLVTLGGRTIMFDCGMHMGYQDERRYPDFSMISKTGTYTQAIDCVIITHFHLDHIGALPYLTEVCGYDGPVYMTYPTKALAPLMLEDYRKVMVERKGEQEQFSVLQIHQCIKKVIAVNLRQTVAIQEDFELRAYYAGHVLGAAMFFVRAGDDTVVYTGDYNMTPDRHLGAAQIDSLRPDLIITESTYATTIRDSKRARERDFLKAVHACVAAGGKVLIPVFALGRAQELCILLDEYWERTNLKAPIFFSAGLTMQANVYYKLLISWTNQKVKDTYSSRNTFDFKHVAPFDRSQIDAPGPCVLFATPGMLSGGLSLEVFKHWAPSEQNMIILPGYCMAGTVGHKLMSGKPTKIELDKRTQIDVRCQVHHLSFSAHTDAKGIMDLVKHVAPRNVVLVHGEKPKIAALKSRIISELSIPCFDPANHETVKISSPDTVKISMSKRFLGEAAVSGDSSRQNIPGSLLEGLKSDECSAELWTTVPPVRTKVPVEGALVTDSNSEKRILHESEVSATLGVEQHKLGYSCLCPIYARNLTAVLADQLPDGGPMEASELSAKLPRLEASTEGMPTAKPFLNKEVTEEPETKRFRGSLQRVLSLDLERVPEVEEGDESCLNLDLEGPPFRSVQGSSTLGGFSSSSWNPNAGLSNPRIDLDINVVPDTTNMDSSPDLAVNSSLAPAGRETPEATSILQGVYTALVKWLGHKIVEGRDCIRGGRTLSVRVAPLSQFDSSHDLASAVESRRLIALLKCEWEEEDNTIAHRVLGLLKGIELKFV